MFDKIDTRMNNTLEYISICSNTITPSRIDLCLNLEKSYVKRFKRSSLSRQLPASANNNNKFIHKFANFEQKLN